MAGRADGHQGIHAVGRIGDMIARAGSDMRADQQQAWEQRQQAQDRIAQNFSDYVRGVERFNDSCLSLLSATKTRLK